MLIRFIKKARSELNIRVYKETLISIMEKPVQTIMFRMSFLKEVLFLQEKILKLAFTM